MRIVLLFIVFNFICLSARSQYMPGTGQPFQFAPLYNPAFTGVENFGDLKFGYRYQWAAFKDNAPQFANLSFNFRIKQPLDLKVNALRTSRTDFENVVPTRKLNAHGLGFNVFNEKYGPINRSGGGAHYALHMPAGKKFKLSAGGGLMLENTKLRGDQLYFGENPDPDPYMEYLKSGSPNHTELWLRGGLLLYSENFYIGGAYYPWSTTLSTSDVAFNNPYYTANIQAGVAFPLNEDIMLRPSVFALLQVDGQWVIDYSAKFFLQEKAWIGLTYRNTKAGIGSAGFNINEKITASYSFEFALGPLRTFTGGTHDLVIALRINNLKRVNQYTW